MSLKKVSGVADGASAVAHEFDTYDPLTNGTARLLTIANDGSVKFDLWHSGYVILGGHMHLNADGVANGGGTLTIGKTGTSSSQGITFNASAQARIEVGTALLHFLTTTGGGGPTIQVSPQAVVANGTSVFKVLNNTGASELFSVLGNGDLKLLSGVATSQVADGASAIGFTLDTANDLDTDGSRILTVQNASVDVFEIGQNTDRNGNSNALTHFYNREDGTLHRETSYVRDTFGSGEDMTMDYFPVDGASNAGYHFWMSDDFSQGAGHRTIWGDIFVSSTTNDNSIEWYSTWDGDSNVTFGSRNDDTQAYFKTYADQGGSSTRAEFAVHGFDQSALSITDSRWIFTGNSGAVKAAIGKNGDMAIEGEFKMKVFSQAAEPTLGADSRMAMWIDTDDSNRVYLIFRRGSGDHVKIELT